MTTTAERPHRYRECTILAPSQIANCFGPLDRMGMLGRRPPFSPDEAVGGPGNWMHVERLPGQSGRIELQIDRRECDERGFWKPATRFDQLHREIDARPDRDLARILGRKTLRYIARLTGEPVNDGLRIQIVIHTPNGKTGLGLGGSASSSAVVMAIDALYGFPIASLPGGEQTILRLMGGAEKIVAGQTFYDNVAPLVIKSDAVYLRPGDDAVRRPRCSRVNIPRDLHMVTITPDYELSTKTMNEALQGETIGLREAEAAAAQYMDVRHALDTGDLDLLIASAGNRIVEPVRGRYIRGFDTVHRLVSDWNSSFPQRKPRFACGISGSGPTLYVLTNSHGNADFAGFEIHRALKEQGIYSWWFCHRPNPNGAEIIELH